MTEQEKLKKITELLNNDAFNNDVSNCSSQEELRAVFAKYGANLEAEEVSEFVSAVKQAGSEGEISEDQLEDVTGGSITAAALLKACVSAGVKGWNWVGKWGRKFANWQDSR